MTLVNKHIDEMVVWANEWREKFLKWEKVPLVAAQIATNNNPPTPAP